MYPLIYFAACFAISLSGSFGAYGPLDSGLNHYMWGLYCGLFAAGVIEGVRLIRREW